MSRGDIVVRLIGDTRDLERKLGEAVTKSKSSFDKLAGVGKAALVGIGGVMVGVGTESLHLADTFEKSHAQLGNALKNSGDSFKKLAPVIDATDKKMEGFGFTSAQTEGALAILTTSTHSGEKALNDMALAANIAKARHIDLNDAALLVGKAAAGNARVLKGFGIAGVDAISKIKDPAQRAAALMSVLGGSFGGAAQAAAGTFGGKMDAVKAKVSDLGAQLGLKLIPIIEKVTDVVLKVVNWLEKHKAVAIALASIIGGLLVVAIGAFVVSLFTAGGALAVVGTALAAITLPIAGVIAGAIALGLVVYEVIKHWKGIATWFKEVWKNVKHWFDDAVRFAKNLFLNFTPEGLIIKHWRGIAAFFKGAWRDVKHWFGDAIDFVKNLFIRYTPEGLIFSHWKGITTFFKNTWDSVINFFKGVPGRITSVARNMWHGITDAFKSAINAIIRGWNSLHFKIPGVHVGPIKVGGFDLGVPHIPTLDTGGVVSRPTLALLAANSRPEAVVPLGRYDGVGQGRTVNYTINVTMGDGTHPAEAGRVIVEKIKQYERRSGATWRST